MFPVFQEELEARISFKAFFFQPTGVGVIGAYKSAFDVFVRRTGSSWGGRLDGFCDRLSLVSIWSLRSPWSLRSQGKKGSAIVWKPLSSDRSDNDRGDRTFCRCDHWRVVSYDRYDRCDRWFFFFLSDQVAIIWKPGFKLIMAYFKRKDCLQRNFYLNWVHVSLWKSLEG